MNPSAWRTSSSSALSKTRYREAEDAPVNFQDLPVIEGALTALNVGRDLIVHTFRDVTHPAMHERWGLEA